jgi:valyl-tRNA synthetase
MPFITEELWQHLCERKDGESIMVSLLQITPEKAVGKEIITEMELVKSIITNVRNIRNEKNIPQKKSLKLEITGKSPIVIYNDVIVKMANLESIISVDKKSDGASAFMVGTTEFAVPLGDLIDVGAEIEKAEAELKHLEGFLIGVQKKLSNEKFMAHAPEQVVSLERKKQSDAESKIATLRDALAKWRE